MAVKSIDHVAIPIENIVEMRQFYEHFGLKWDSSGEPLLFAVTLDSQKINFHARKLWENARFTLRAPNAQVGCGDFCFVWEGEHRVLTQKIAELDIEIETGPVERQGGKGQGISFYVRDPDNNLVEFISYTR